MRRFAISSLLLVLFVSCLAFLSVPAARADYYICWSLGFLNETPHSLTVNAHIVEAFAPSPFSSASLTLQPGASGVLTISASVPDDAEPFVIFDSNPPTFLGAVSFGDNASECGIIGGGRITDGRVNDSDLGAPMAAYCKNDRMEIWDIDSSGHGTFAFTATIAQITAALNDAKTSGVNVLIAEGLGNSLYALSSNELVLIGPDVKAPGKLYQRILAADVCP